jgi:hypothetical protein
MRHKPPDFTVLGWHANRKSERWDNKEVDHENTHLITRYGTDFHILCLFPWKGTRFGQKQSAGISAD